MTVDGLARGDGVANTVIITATSVVSTNTAEAWVFAFGETGL
jgi:hypothetical protein